MAGLVPAIHVLQVCPSMQSKPDPAGNPEWNDMYDCITWQSTWVAGTSPDKPGHDGVPDDGGPADFMIPRPCRSRRAALPHSSPRGTTRRRSRPSILRRRNPPHSRMCAKSLGNDGSSLDRLRARFDFEDDLSGRDLLALCDIDR